jgi:hypothetical protein
MVLTQRFSVVTTLQSTLAMQRGYVLSDGMLDSSPFERSIAQWTSLITLTWSPPRPRSCNVNPNAQRTKCG